MCKVTATYTDIRHSRTERCRVLKFAWDNNWDFRNNLGKRPKMEQTPGQTRTKISAARLDEKGFIHFL